MYPWQDTALSYSGNLFRAIDILHYVRAQFRVVAVSTTLTATWSDIQHCPSCVPLCWNCCNKSSLVPRGILCHLYTPTPSFIMLQLVFKWRYHDTILQLKFMQIESHEYALNMIFVPSNLSFPPIFVFYSPLIFFLFLQCFTGSPHYSLIKELFIKIFSTPYYHPKIKPFIDHMFHFGLLDNHIWFRNYQV